MRILPYHYTFHVTGADEGSVLDVRGEPSASGKMIGSFAANAPVFCEYTGDHVVDGNW